MSKNIEIKYNDQLWNFELKDLTSKLAEEIENATTEVMPDGTVQPVGGVGTYKSIKLRMCLAKTHDGSALDQEYVDSLPMAIRNTLLSFISKEEDGSKSFREVPR